MNPEQAQWFAETSATLVTNVERAVRGKRHVVTLAVTCLLAEGHLLLEDVPGTGKTSLAQALARTVQGTEKRIQFTPDLLPSDVTGSSVYDQRTGTFEFRHGPVFATVVLADKINRASPKTQSALLEVMEEGRVTVDGERHEVGRPFMVVATQNPVEQAGTYRLPEAQLDRFLMRTSLGYPDHETTIAILADAGRGTGTAVDVAAVITAPAVVEMAALAATVDTDPAILDYIARLVEATRTFHGVRLGASVRGALALVRSAKVWAAQHGRHFVTPDDVKALAAPVLAHRLVLDPESEFNGLTTASVLGSVLAQVDPPVARQTARA